MKWMIATGITTLMLCSSIAHAESVPAQQQGTADAAKLDPRMDTSKMTPEQLDQFVLVGMSKAPDMSAETFKKAEGFYKKMKAPEKQKMAQGLVTQMLKDPVYKEKVLSALPSR